jgi:hypothetical protein
LAAMVHPLNKFPEQYQSLANELLEYYRSINWGAPEVVASTPSSNQRHRSTASAASTGEGSSTSYKRPPPDHPIYGRSGIFRHIQRSSGGSSTVSYRVDPDFRSRAYDVFGANGLSVGDWWPLQICANRDGAHGKRPITPTDSYAARIRNDSFILHPLSFESRNSLFTERRFANPSKVHALQA